MLSLTNDSRRFLSTSVRLGGVIDFVLTLGMVGTWIGCLGRFHWFLALFDHFRVQGSIACFVALVILLIRRSWRLACFALVSLSVNLWPLIQTNSPLPAGIVADDQVPLKMISLNVLTSNTKKAEVLSYLQASDADVILLLEIDDLWAASMSPLRKSHPHGLTEPRIDNFGIALFSRLPLSDLQQKSFAGEEVPSIVVTIHAGDKRIRFIGTHPVPLMSGESYSYGIKQFRGIGAFVDQRRDIPAIVMGDFNATPWSLGMTILREKSDLDFRTPKAVWRPTWQVGSLLSLPIDHALCTPPLFFEKREIGPDLGSDHRPQELTVRWSKVTTS